MSIPLTCANATSCAIRKSNQGERIVCSLRNTLAINVVTSAVLTVPLRAPLVRPRPAPRLRIARGIALNEEDPRCWTTHVLAHCRHIQSGCKELASA